jgi:hypothetical protein
MVGNNLDFCFPWKELDAGFSSDESYVHIVVASNVIGTEGSYIIVGIKAGIPWRVFTRMS